MAESRATVTHADLFPPGDSSFRDKGGNESQLLVQRCRQPHGFHQNQNQRPQRGPVHHPACRGGGHIRCALRPLCHQLQVAFPSVRSASVTCFCCFPAAPGIYSSTEMLDFGTLRSQGMESHNRVTLSNVFSDSESLLTVLRSSFPLCGRSPKTAESTPFKFRSKRCSNYSRYPFYV